MTTIHLIYPHGAAISCPDAIGRNLSKRLRKRYEVRQYNYEDTMGIKPGPSDVLIGHAHPAPGTIFRRSAKHGGWKRILMLEPYNHDPKQNAFLDPLIRHCNLFLAITGNYWFNSIEKSLFQHWKPKMVHVDLAIDRQDFPQIKTKFNEPGRRRFLYIGHSFWQKNPGYLSEISSLLPKQKISWIGGGRRGILGLNPLGVQDFRSAQAKQLVAEHDFLITVSKADANPATILEAMAWGLIPVCTPQSGYIGFPGIQNIPLDDVRNAVKILRELQETPASNLLEMQSLNFEALDKHFNWDRFVDQIVEAIESDYSPPLGEEPWRVKAKLAWAGLTSPYSILSPLNLLRFVIRSLRKRSYAADLFFTWSKKHVQKLVYWP
jgi:glycosyltransferase involved in cell wall biosynthesis